MKRIAIIALLLSTTQAFALCKNLSCTEQSQNPSPGRYTIYKSLDSNEPSDQYSNYGDYSGESNYR